MPVDPTLLSTIRWRCIGPPRGGRVVAVAGHPTNPAIAYFGACAGGVWRTDDAGQYWQNISDGFFKTAAVGALAVAPSDPNVIYAGTGEYTIRTDVSHGDGVYKSTDGGQSWRNIGLQDTRHISEIRIHPQNPDLVYVAALGHAFGPNEERGVFRSRDGGETWQKVLYVSDKAGAVDLVLDSSNPRILYAALYEMYRNFWTLSSGGPGSGIYRSDDGGETWIELSENKGLPAGILGRIGLAVSPARSGRVWALIEADDPGFYRSDDGGETWELLTDKPELRMRPWYFSHIFADSQNADTVYVLNLGMWKSKDGGRTFDEISTPHGDNHDLWINPDNPQHLVQGNDGGACISHNGGASWSTIYNQLTAQFYHVAVDNQFPYRVVGTQQDNSSLSVPSRTGLGAITWQHCYPAGTGESGHIAVHPDNPDIVYVGAVGSSPGGGGALQRYDHSTGQTSLVTVWPELYSGHDPIELKYRFQWTFPILFSPHDSSVIYATGNVAFRSDNEGQSWQAISPDLTRADPEKLKASGGPLTKDTTGAEHYGTIYAFTESAHEAGVFWAGSDDGLVHISRDGGANWADITPSTLPEWSLISMIEPSPHDAATAYLAATRYKLDDPRPLLFKTNDYGQTWTPITSGIPEDDFTRVIREDPGRRGLLYAGTETAIYVSFDDGAHWQRLNGNLPAVPIYDMVLKENDLVVATHGRSFWILDDVTLLHQLSDTLAASGLALLTPRDTIRLLHPIFGKFSDTKSKNKHYMIGLAANAAFYVTANDAGEPLFDMLDAGQDPPHGVVINYYCKEKPEEELRLRILDAGGDEVNAYSSIPQLDEDDEAAGSKAPVLPAEPGMNRFVWDMHHADAVPLEKDKILTLSGPMAAPGSYQVELTQGDTTLQAPFKLLPDPRVQTPEAELQAKAALQLQIRDKLSEATTALNQLRDAREQLTALTGRLDRISEAADLRQAAEALVTSLTAVEERLIQTNVQIPAQFMGMRALPVNKLAELPTVMASADRPVTEQTYAVFEHLSSQIDSALADLQELMKTEIAAFNERALAIELPAVLVQADA